VLLALVLCITRWCGENFTDVVIAALIAVICLKRAPAPDWAKFAKALTLTEIPRATLKDSTIFAGHLSYVENPNPPLKPMKLEFPFMRTAICGHGGRT
jgi:hypothetical protein